MPFTGFDPPDMGGPIDVSGGGINPSTYYLLSPGGRFPGDIANFLEYIAGRGTPDPADPNYKLPDWANNLPGWLGRFAKFHEWNNQNNGAGSVSDPLGGYPYHFFSGPGAQYGPPGGPLHGLADQGRNGFLDGIDYPGNPLPGGRDAPPPKKGGGGGYNGPKGLPAYGGLNFQPQFLDWQPSNGAPTTPTHFVSGKGQAFAPAPAAQKPGKGGKNQKPPKQTQPPGRAGGGGKGGGKAPPPQQTPPPGPPGSDPFLDWIKSLLGGNPPVPGGGSGGSMQMGPQLRDGYTGIDTGNLDKGTPGWHKDPTTGVTDTSGMPRQTPRAPSPGESESQYMDYLHSIGFGLDEILGFMGDRGFQRGDDGNWSYDGWGTGPVVRTDNGYQFANQTGGGGNGGGGGGGGITDDPSNVWKQVLLR